MAQMYEDNLPSTASALIRAALKDLTWVENRPTIYRVDMTNSWHVEKFGATDRRVRCDVCLAGAVLAASVGLRPGSRVSLSIFDGFKVELPNNSFAALPESMSTKLLALNDFRQGLILGGMQNLYGDELDDDHEQVLAELALQFDLGGVDYSDGPGYFRQELGRMANALEKLGY